MRFEEEWIVDGQSSLVDLTRFSHERFACLPAL